MTAPFIPVYVSGHVHVNMSNFEFFTGVKTVFREGSDDRFAVFMCALSHVPSPLVRTRDPIAKLD